MMTKTIGAARRWGEQGLRAWTPCCNVQVRIDLYGTYERTCQCGKTYICTPSGHNRVTWIEANPE